MGILVGKQARATEPGFFFFSTKIYIFLKRLQQRGAHTHNTVGWLPLQHIRAGHMFNSSGEKEERLEKNGKTGDRPFVSQYMMRRVSRRTLIPFPTFPRRGTSTCTKTWNN